MSLENYANMLTEDIKEAVRFEVIETAREALINHVNATVYASRGSSYYDRTFELLEAIEIRDFRVTSSRATFTLGFNNSRIHPYVNPSEAKLNWHTGVAEDFNYGIDGLLDTLENGSSGSPIYNSPAHGFMDKTYNELASTLVKTMGSALSRRGWKVTIF